MANGQTWSVKELMSGHVHSFVLKDSQMKIRRLGEICGFDDAKIETMQQRYFPHPIHGQAEASGPYSVISNGAAMGSLSATRTMTRN